MEGRVIRIVNFVRDETRWSCVYYITNRKPACSSTGVSRPWLTGGGISIAIPIFMMALVCDHKKEPIIQLIVWNVTDQEFFVFWESVSVYKSCFQEQPNSMILTYKIMTPFNLRITMAVHILLGRKIFGRGNYSPLHLVYVGLRRCWL